MYATIPEDAEAKQPKNQAPGPVRRGYGLVVAVCVGVIIGTLGTIAFVGGPEAPSRAAMELDQDLVDALPTPTRDPAAARCYAKRYQDVERKLCPSGRYQPSCAEKMRGHYVAHGAEEGRVYGCSGERDSFKPTA